jgi:hypothetical protein
MREAITDTPEVDIDLVILTVEGNRVTELPH